MLTLRAFDFRLFAYAFDPLIRAGRRVARLACLSAFKAAWIHIFTTAEERANSAIFLQGRNDDECDSSIPLIMATFSSWDHYCSYDFG